MHYPQVVRLDHFVSLYSWGKVRTFIYLILHHNATNVITDKRHMATNVINVIKRHNFNFC